MLRKRAIGRSVPRIGMIRNMENRQRRGIYLLLLLAQIIGAGIIIWNVLPDFRQLVLTPGHQLPDIHYDNIATLGALFVMQVAYWYRLRRLPIPFQGSSLILNHLLLFLGRLSFIFGGTLFSLVFFRHLPALDHGTDLFVMSQRGLLLSVAMFALFCFSLELERLGHAFGRNQRD
jgi:hypothetical protein